MGFLDINGFSNIEHTPSAVFSPTEITGGAGVWRVKARLTDNSTFQASPANGVQVGDVVATIYTQGADRRVVTFEVTTIYSASGRNVDVQLESMDDPEPAWFPTGNAGLCRTTNGDYLRVVEGEPTALTIAKLNNLIENIQQSAGGTVNWAQTDW
jgi:hypothetical protein